MDGELEELGNRSALSVSRVAAHWQPDERVRAREEMKTKDDLLSMAATSSSSSSLAAVCRAILTGALAGGGDDGCSSDRCTGDFAYWPFVNGHDVTARRQLDKFKGGTAVVVVVMVVVV